MDPGELANRLQRVVGDRYRIVADSPDLPEARAPWRLFLAREAAGEQLLAIKAMPTGELDPVVPVRFEREVGILEYAMRGLDREAPRHPRLLPILSRGSGEDVLYYATPWLAEGSLKARLARESRLSTTETVTILRDLAEGLGVLHRHGAVHLHIKPANVLFDGGRAVLADGCSRFVGNAFAPSDLEHAAPEVIRGGTASLQSDLYGLGSLAFSMLAGRGPQVGTFFEMAYARVSATAPPVTSLRPEVPRALNDVIARAIAVAPEERFADAAAFRAALEDFRPRDPV